MWPQTRQCSSPRASHEIASSKSRAVTGSMVKVGSWVRSRRATSGGRAAFAGRAAPPRTGRPGALGGGLDPGRERGPQAAIEHQRLDDVAGDVRAPEHPRDLVAPALRVGVQQGQASRARVARALDRHPPAAPEERLADEEAPALLEQDDARRGVGQDGHLAPATAIARSSPSSLFVLGSSLARTSGMIPLPVETPLPPRLRPLGVKYWPAVMSSAPPLESSRTSWKTPLPKVSVPTTFARSRSCSAPVTISEAEAVSPLTRTDIGAVGTTGSPVARSVCSLTARPRVVTIGPSFRKAEAMSCASDTSPPPLSRRSSTKTLAPRFCSLRSAA